MLKNAIAGSDMNKLYSRPSHRPFARGHSTVLGVPDPSGWVRGKAVLDRKNAELTMVLGLETDSCAAGVKGRMSVSIYDAQHALLAKVRMPREIGIPGKAPGKARIQEFALTKTIPADIAAKAAELVVDVEYTGPQVGPWGISLDVIKDVLQLIV